MKKASYLMAALVAFSSAAFAADDKTVAGAVVGGVAGAVIGNEVGGKNGALVGAAVGGVAGATIANSKPKPLVQRVTAPGAAQPQPVAVRPVPVQPVAVQPVVVQPQPVAEGYDEGKRHGHHDRGNHYGQRKHHHGNNDE